MTTGERLNTRQAEQLAEQLASLAASEVPLAEGLRALSIETPDPATRRAFAFVASQLEAGVPLPEALASPAIAIPGYLPHLFAAGLQSGRLPEVLAEISGEAGQGRLIRRRFWMSLIYPALLLACGAAILELLSALNPLSAYELTGEPGGILGLQLPLAGSILLRIGPWIILGPALVAAATLLLLRLLFAPAERRSLLLQLPLVGPLYRFTGLAEFFRLLSWLIEAQVPLAEAVSLAGRGIHDPALAGAAVQVEAALVRGESLPSAMKDLSLFPDGTGQYLEWSNRSSSPGEALRLASELCLARARLQGRFASLVINVLTIGLLFLWLLLLLVCLILPPVQLLEALI